MQINSSLNNLIQLEKKLEASTNNLRKLTQENKHSGTKEQKDLDHKLSKQKSQDDLTDSLSEEIVEQEISIPLAYTANAKVISMQNTNQKVLLDIKV